MRGIIAVTVRLIRAAQRVSTKKGRFFGLFGIVFISSVVTLAQLDLLPDAPPAQTASADILSPVPTPAPAAESTPSVTVRTSFGIQSPQSVELLQGVDLPLKIEIAKINLSVKVSNPATAGTAQLDNALLRGAVRYPSSGRLNEAGNVVLFGHSSYLPVVNNQAYKTFNGIQRLKAGDVITVYAYDRAYTYVTRSVTKEAATSAQGIPLEVSGRVLTLVTCNSFGTKEDRFVVVADFVDSHSILP